jgi:peptide deformylase
MLDEEEGCLSVPGVYGMVKRHAWIDIEYDDMKGTHHKIRAADFFARVLQHETDHTNGMLFVDKATSFTRGTPPIEPGKLS